MIRRARESIIFQPVREDFPSKYAFRVRFSHFLLSFSRCVAGSILPAWSRGEIHRPERELLRSWEKQILIHLAMYYMGIQDGELAKKHFEILRSLDDKLAQELLNTPFGPFFEGGVDFINM
jgi:hypothetical protein